MENYILVKNDELYHFGILGMKWGICRYQNKDGSLTEAGRKRRGEDAKKLGEIKSDIAYNTYNQYAFRNASKEKSEEYYKNIETGTKSYNRLYALMVGRYGAQNLENLDDIPEFKESYKRGEAWLKSLDELRAYNKEKEARMKELESMTAKETGEYLRKQNLFDETMARKNPERADKVAKFGLEVMRDQMGYKDVDPNDKGDKEWFIWEDQTIGYPTIADMALRGKSLDNIKKTIAVAEKHRSMDDTHLVKSDDGKFVITQDNPDYDYNIPGVFQLSERGSTEYAEACINQLNKNKK